MPHHWKSAEYLVAPMLLLQIGMVTAKNASEDFTQKWFIVKRSLKDRLLNWLKLLISHCKWRKVMICWISRYEIRLSWTDPQSNESVWFVNNSYCCLLFSNKCKLPLNISTCSNIYMPYYLSQKNFVAISNKDRFQTTTALGNKH